MRNATIATLGATVVVVAFLIGSRIAGTDACGVVIESGEPIPATCATETEIAERVDALRSRSARAWNETDACRIVEHGPTGPEPSVNVGWTVRVCQDGTRHISEWHISTGDVFATYTVTP